MKRRTTDVGIVSDEGQRREDGRIFPLFWGHFGDSASSFAGVGEAKWRIFGKDGQQAAVCGHKEIFCAQFVLAACNTTRVMAVAITAVHFCR
jgi:hypothetical protein